MVHVVRQLPHERRIKLLLAGNLVGGDPGVDAFLLAGCIDGDDAHMLCACWVFCRHGSAVVVGRNRERPKRVRRA